MINPRTNEQNKMYQKLLLSPSFQYLWTSSIIKKSSTNKWKCIRFCKNIGQKVAETHYGHTKIALEDSDARKCLIAFRVKKMGGTSRFFTLDWSDENVFTVPVFGRKNFEFNLEHLLFLSNASLSIDILPHFWLSIFINLKIMY